MGPGSGILTGHLAQNVDLRDKFMYQRLLSFGLPILDTGHCKGEQTWSVIHSSTRGCSLKFFVVNT